MAIIEELEYWEMLWNGYGEDEDSHHKMGTILCCLGRVR